ncbi:hypothetical protein Tco_0588134 [Tanacetum coccineum]
MGGSSSQPRTDPAMSLINAFLVEDLYTPEFSESLQENTGYWQEPNPHESPVEQVTTSPTQNKKPTRNLQKRPIQSDDAPRQIPWTTKVGLPFLKTSSMTVRPAVIRFCGVYGNVMRLALESGAEDEYYVQRAMIHYQAETGLPFKFRHCWDLLKDSPKWKEIALLNFNTGCEGCSKRHKSSGSIPFNTKSGDVSINLNTSVADEVRTIDQSAGGKLRDRNAEESWALLEDLALYDNESWNDPRDFAKPVKAISLPQDVPSTSDRRLIELENQVQRLMEAHLAPMQPTQVNKITSSCEICSGPHDTQYCMENPEQAFVEYASSRTDEAGGKWYTFKPEQNNLGDTYNPSWKSHPNLRWRQPQNSQNNFSNPPNRFQPNGSIPNRSFNNNPQNFNSQSNLEGLVSNFMASQDARLSKFEADFKQQQSEMTNKIDTVLKAITDRMAGALPSDTDGEGIEWLDVEEPLDLVDTSEESVYESLIKEMPKCSLNYDFRIKKGDPRNLKIPCMIGHKFTANAYIDVDLPMNIMSLAYYNSIRKNGYEYRGRNFIGLGRDMHVFVRNMSYVMDFTILENIETNIDPSLSHVIFGLPFIKIACLAINRKHGLMTFMDGTKDITFKTPYKDLERSKLSSEGHDLLSSRSSDRVGAQIPYYARKDFLRTAICHGRVGIAREPRSILLMRSLAFRRMVEFLGAIPINLKRNMWESEGLN